MTEQEVLQRCRAEYPTRLTQREPVFIYSESGEPVGVYFPKKRGVFWCIGFIYVLTEYRRKGYALQTVDRFRRENPGMLWYAERTHEASQQLAFLMQLQFVGCQTDKDGTLYDVYQDSYRSALIGG